MYILAVILTVITSLVSLIWSSRHIKIYKENKNGFILDSDCPGPPPDAPLISVVVAAKDEEATIESCVRTMLSQDYPNFELIVCNDRSEDRTADIVEKICDEDTRLKLINIEELPEGWCGKNNAMQIGIGASSGEWICMIDADCRQLSSRTLSVALEQAISTNTDMLSILPTLEMKGFWENVVQPVCSGVMMIWFDPDKVNSPAHKSAYANGAFILISKDAYEKIGTHEAIKGCINEDMHMASEAKGKGLRLKVVRSEELYTVRMYTSLKAIIQGWSRIFFGTFGTLKRLVASFALMFCMGPLPYLTAAVGLTLYATGGSTAWLVAGLAGSAAAIIQMSVIFRFYRILQGRPCLFWTYCLGCVITLYAIVKAIGNLRSGAKLVWKNTHYATAGRK